MLLNRLPTLSASPLFWWTFTSWMGCVSSWGTYTTIPCSVQWYSYVNATITYLGSIAHSYPFFQQNRLMIGCCTQSIGCKCARSPSDLHAHSICCNSPNVRATPTSCHDISSWTTRHAYLLNSSNIIAILLVHQHEASEMLLAVGFWAL